MDAVGYEMSKVCADKVFKEAGFSEGEGRDQVGVVELHDCFAANEVRSADHFCVEYILKDTSFSSLHILHLVFVLPTKPTSSLNEVTIL